MKVGKNIRIIATILSSLTLIANLSLLITLCYIGISDDYFMKYFYYDNLINLQGLVWLITGAMLFFPIKRWLKIVSLGVIVLHLSLISLYPNWLSKG